MKNQLFKIAYWFSTSIVIAFLLHNSIPSYWNAWLIALFLLPAAFIVKYGFEKSKSLIGFKKWLRYFFLAVISLYWGYIAITIAYWYFLELKGGTLDKILINPIFLWILIGFFVLLDNVLFKNTRPKDAAEEEDAVVTIYSNRKKTSIHINKIAFIESKGNFTVVWLEDGSQYKNAVKISEWQNRLQSFLRIHRSFLINTDFATLNGNEVRINAQWTLPISRGYKKEVFVYFDNS